MTTTTQRSHALSEHVIELLYQELEAEQGDVLVCQAALHCVEAGELRDTWERHLDETQRHVELLTGLMHELGLDPDHETAGRRRVRAISRSLIRSMLLGLEPEGATAGVQEGARLN
jgi:hypothetical protein